MPQLALGFQPPHKLDIFHQRDVGKAAHAIEDGAPDENALVTVRKIEQAHAPAHARLDDARLPLVGIEAKGETSSYGGARSIEQTKAVQPPIRQLAVGVQEPEPPTARARGARVQLRAATSGRVNPQNVCASCTKSVRITVSCNRHDDLDIVLRRQLLKHLRERFVPGDYRDDD
jgi:hypothetical protein